MSFGYPIIYLLYQLLMIFIIGLINDQSYSIYLAISFQSAYLIVIIIYRPYNEYNKFNSMLHNGTIIFNQSLTLFVTIVIIKWNSLYKENNYLESNSEVTAYFIIILICVILALALAILRLVYFNKPISGDCCKKQLEEEDFKQLQ